MADVTAPSELNRLFVPRMRAAAERESDIARALEWRDAPMERHERVLREVLGLAEAIQRGKGGISHRPPPMVVKDRVLKR